MYELVTSAVYFIFWYYFLILLTSSKIIFIANTHTQRGDPYFFVYTGLVSHLV